VRGWLAESVRPEKPRQTRSRESQKNGLEKLAPAHLRLKGGKPPPLNGANAIQTSPPVSASQTNTSQERRPFGAES